MNIQVTIISRFDSAQYRHLIKTIEKESEKTMSAITQLQEKFDAAMAKVSTAFADASRELKVLAQRVADLTAAIANGEEVDPNELAQLEADISSTADALSAKAEALESDIATADAPPTQSQPQPPPPPSSPPPTSAPDPAVPDPAALARKTGSSF